MMTEVIPPPAAVSHLHAATFDRVTRNLLAKAIGEFAHELLIEPRLERADGAWGRYAFAADDPNVEYRFRAQIMQLDHWLIDRDSIRKLDHGQDAPLDLLRFVIDLRERLAIPAEVLPEYLHELSCTLFAAAYTHSRSRPSADELAHASFQEIEAAMTAGHPVFVANSGRIGFSAADYPRYAPEAASSVALVWLAASKRRAEFSCVRALSYAQLVHEELGPGTCAAFARTLSDRGLDPDAFLFIPVHPWQWENRLALLFAADIACGDLCYLGPGADEYRVQQSIRTFYNLSCPTRRYAKTSLSILNMGFTRGIPASVVGSAAAVNDWVFDLVEADEYLRDLNFSALREVAFVAMRHRGYETVIARRSDAYKELLGAMWRENPLPRLQPGQRLMTMAALMHVDAAGDALLPALIRASGIGIDDWLRRYFDCYLKPLVHCFYTHNLLFTPHCENTILVLDGAVPAGAIIKDIAEDIGVVNPEVDLPGAVRRIALRVPEETMTLGVFTDVFDCVFRFLAPILQEHEHYPESRFWQLVAECIEDYEREHPHLAEKFRRYDLFAPAFARNCLNRLQLRNNRMMVDLNATDPVDSLQFVGELKNPIAGNRAYSARRAS